MYKKWVLLMVISLFFLSGNVLGNQQAMNLDKESLSLDSALDKFTGSVHFQMSNELANNYAQVPYLQFSILVRVSSSAIDTMLLSENMQGFYHKQFATVQQKFDLKELNNYIQSNSIKDADIVIPVTVLYEYARPLNLLNLRDLRTRLERASVFKVKPDNILLADTKVWVFGKVVGN